MLKKATKSDQAIKLSHLRFTINGLNTCLSEYDFFSFPMWVVIFTLK